MNIEHLLEENTQIATRAAKMRLKRASLPRFLKNWLRNSDGEAECQERILENQNKLFQLFNAELSSIQKNGIFSDLYLVHSMAKVGGISIWATLTATFKEATIIHLHCLTEEGCKRWLGASAKYEKQSTRDAVLEQLRRARNAVMLLEMGKLLFPVTQKRAVICGVREPIAWALSLYFQSYTAMFDRDCSCDEITVEMARDYVASMLRNEMCHLGPTAVSPEKWLTDEFFPAHHFDIFSHDFDVNKGYQVYEGDKTSILFIRQENLALLSESLSLLLDYPKELIVTANENIGESKDYSERYRLIKDKLKFDGAFLRPLYSSRYCKQFYSEAERQSFMTRWMS